MLALKVPTGVASMNSGAECVWPVGAVLGEGPMWSAGDSTLWFVDIKGQRLHAFNEATGRTRSFVTPEAAAFIFRHGLGGMLCGLRSGLFRFDPEADQFDSILKVEAARPANRLNDGYVDAHGRLWFGTMDNKERGKTGAFYRFDERGLAKTNVTGVAITNPAFRPSSMG